MKIKVINKAALSGNMNSKDGFPCDKGCGTGDGMACTPDVDFYVCKNKEGYARWTKGCC